MKNCNIVDVVYFDIAKAFDPFSHLKLIHKLFFPDTLSWELCSRDYLQQKLRVFFYFS